MTLEEFRRLADTWGRDIKRWPEAAQDAARKLAVTREATEILESARRLDQLLAKRPEVSRERSQRAAHAVALRLAAQAQHNARPAWTWDFSGWLVPAASVACSLALGISLAMTVPYAGYGDDQESMVVLGLILDNSSMAAGWELR